VVLLAALLVLRAPGALAHPMQPHAVTVSGTVVNSSHGDAPLAGQPVTLVEVAGGQAANAATAMTDGAGRFTFANITPDDTTSFVLTVQYQGGVFTSSSFDSTQLGAQPVTLHVFDTTADDSTVLVALTTLVLDEPKARAGLISIAESVTVYNTGNMAYVATVQPTATKPMNLLRFALPSGARNIVLGAGFATVQVIQAPTGFGVTATIPPGKSEFAFAYDVPYTGASFAVATRAEYATRQVVALMPTDLRLDAGDFSVRPPIDAAGGHFQLLEQNNVAAGKTLTFTLRSLPLPGEPQYLDAKTLAGIGGLLALLLALVLAFYLRRGDLAPLLRLAGVASPVRRAVAPRDVERRALLRQHLALDDLRVADKLGEAEYLRRRDELRARLRALLAEQATSQSQRRTFRASQRGGGVPARTTPRKEASATKVPATPGGAA
jgi:hypothetical protein